MKNNCLQASRLLMIRLRLIKIVTIFKCRELGETRDLRTTKTMLRELRMIIMFILKPKSKKISQEIVNHKFIAYYKHVDGLLVYTNLLL